MAKPIVVNVNMADANEEYSYSIPISSKSFTIKLRQSVELRVAFVEGASGETYISIPPGATWTEELTLSSDLTIYFQAEQAGVVAEIIYRV